MAQKVERGKTKIVLNVDNNKTTLNPSDTLYKICTTAVIENFPRLRGGLDLCPENLIFDVIFEVYKR